MLSQKQRLLEKMTTYGKLSLLADFEMLSEEEQKCYLDEIDKMDFSVFERANQMASKSYDVSPIPVLTAEEIEKRKDIFIHTGLQEIRENKVAALLLCGGQGTRLGFPHPKGMFNIGVTKTLYIFELHFRYLLHVAEECGNFFPVFIMTSIYNHAEIKAFLKEHEYFGYREDAVYFYTQSTVHATDLKGNLLRASQTEFVLSPDGNGGWFASLEKAGLLPTVKKLGVQWMNVVSIDNVLQKTVDPAFVGATVLSGLRCGAKVIRKNAPDERIGLICRNHGRPSVIEYYELDKLTANGYFSLDGMEYGVILNYLFPISEMEKTLTEAPLPIHKVKKKIPYFDGEKTVIPETENGYKYEMLATDLVEYMDTCLPYEVIREDEFAPVKNKTGTDSVDSARRMLQNKGYTL